MSAISFEKHLPRLLLEQIERFDADQPFTVRFPAAVMMTDISGFSALAVELTREGAHGVEALQQTLDTYFGALGAVVARCGGDIATFAGDAVFAVWPAGDDPAQAAARAVQCALSIQQESGDWWQGHSNSLTQRIAVSSGEISLSKLGGAGGKWLNVFAGAPVVEAGRVCDVTTPGQVLVTPAVAALLGGRIEGEVSVEGCVRVDRLQGAIAMAALPSATAVPADPQRLAAYVPDVLVRRANAGHDDWLAEFRVVTVMFVKLENVDFDATDAGHRLQDMTRTVQQAVQHYGGALPYVQMDDKGLNFIIAFGIPTAAYEDDAARALSAGLEIQRALRAIGMLPSIGVATGVLYCGECGALHRRQYSMIGPAINLAARLAAAAPDDLLSDDQTSKAAGERLSFTVARNVQTKQADAPVLALRPEWRARSSTNERSGAMVGREAELRQLLDALHAGKGGEGARLLVSGDAGIGKSRLLAELCRSLEAAGMAVVSGDAQAIERNTPYCLWRDVLRTLLGLIGLPGESGADTVRRHLRSDAQLLSWAPLLGDILPLAIPETDLTREMRGSARASAMQALLLHLLQQAAGLRPLVLMAHDLHWIDALSASALLMLAERAPTLSIVACSRPLQGLGNPAAESFCRHPALRTIELGVLDRDQSAAMVCGMLGIGGVPAELSQLVHGRCAGNPFYIQQLTLALREAGHIDVVGGRCQLKGDIAQHVSHAMPGTLRGVIASRVDRLSDEHQLLLKVASVFGRVFSGAALAAVHPVAQQARRILELLSGLAGSNLVVNESAAGDDSFAFSHVLVQEAIYELLPLAQRRRQHRRIADWLEAQHGAGMAGYFGLLANHCMLAEDFARAVDHLEGGARTAIRQAAYREAVQHVETAQRITAERRLDADALRRARWHGLLGDSHHELTELKLARTEYLRVLELLGRPYAPGAWARATGILAELARLRLGGLAASTVPDAAARQVDERRLASRAYAQLSEIHYYENDPIAVLHLTLLSVREAQRSGSLPELSAGYGGLAIAFGQMGMAGAARAYVERSMALAEARPAEVHGIAYAHLLAAVMASSQCDWALLESSGRRAEVLYGELGEHFRLVALRAMRAHSAIHRGRYAEAAPVLDAMAASLTPDTPERVRGWRLCAQLQLAVVRGTVARTDIDDMLHTLQGAEMPIDRLMIFGSVASARLQLGETGAALHAARQGLELLLGRTPVAGAGYVLGPLGVVEALLACSDQVPPQEAAAHAVQVRQACAALRIYTRQVPSTRPRGYFLLACQAERNGARRRALGLWRKALVAAQAHAMPYDEAAAGMALAQRLPQGGAGLEQARQIFSTLQVPVPTLFQPKAL